MNIESNGRDRVLCVESTPDVQLIIEATIRSLISNIEFKAVPTVAEAQAYLKQELPILITLSNELPDGLGIEFLEELRRDGSPFKNTPIFMITGTNPQGIAKKCMEYNAALIQKPLIDRPLREHLKKLFGIN